ncbi:hypothetical protein BR93DRAFT_931574 [Coniochaeta sp. PMI_546]|nr:hypothetical protein BR93DRAFT_931574 [Coniochaeta sp. PMI_546]
MASCGGDRFCCGHDFDEGKCNCSSNGGAFTINPGRAQTVLGVSDTSFTGSPTYVSPTRHQTALTAGESSARTSLGVSTTGSGSTRTTSPVTSSPTSSSMTRSSSLSSSSRSTTSASSPTPTANQNGTDSTSGGGTSNSLKIGLGVGIPLAVLAIVGAALGYFLWYRRQKQDRGIPVGGTAGGWATSDDLAENERSESPVLSRPAGAPGMTQTRV